MKRLNLACFVLVILFLVPMMEPATPQPFSPTDVISDIESQGTALSEGTIDRTGTGEALTVTMNGVATNRLDGTFVIDSSTSEIGTVTLSDGWSGSNLQATVDTLSMDVTDALINPTWNDYHEEKFFDGFTSDWYEDVAVPDGWTLTKQEADENAHPHHGDWELNDGSGGYGGSRGFRFETYIDSSSDPSDGVTLSQLVNAPWRDVYSAEVKLRYYVISGYNTTDLVHLFVNFAGIENKFLVFEQGDPTNTWLQEAVTLTSAQLQSVSLPDALLLEVGMATDSTGTSPTVQVRAYIDEIELTLNVRPFPEQIDLKVNGTAVVGSEAGSVYPYLPDDSNRDAYDDYDNGIDLNGWPWGGGSGDLDVGVYGTAWSNAQTFQTGMQFPLNIPQGAAVTSAWIEIEQVTTSLEPSMRIYVSGFKSSGLPIENFTAGTPHMEDLFDWVPTSVDWSPNGWDSPVRIRHQSPDIASLLQGVVSNSSWSSGEYVCVMLDYMHSTNYQAWNTIMGSAGYNQDEVARLFVEYLMPQPEDTVYFMQFEKDITIDYTEVAGDLTNFPVLIDITDTDLKTDVQADGDDIVFRMGDEALDYEIELFDQDYSPTHAHLVAWVKVPSLSSSTDTVLTMAYGNTNAGSSSSTTVWDEFETVHHLNQDPIGTQYDSTSNNHDGTSYGTMGSEDGVTGRIDGAVDFDNETLDMIGIGQIDTDAWTSFTVSLWVNMDEDRDCRVFSKSESTTSTQHIMTTRLANNRRFSLRFRTDGYGGQEHNAGTSLTLGSWYYWVWSWDATRGTIEGYLNGNLDLDQVHGGTSVYDSIAVFTIGNTDMTNNRYFDGTLDEIRLTTSVRTEAWIDTEYNNQLSPSTFFSVGSERNLQSSWSDTESATAVFSTTSLSSLDTTPIMTMDISGGGQSLDENMNDGTSFYVANDSIVEWTAKVLVSPPSDTSNLDVQIDYPFTEWKPISVTDPIGQSKTYGTDWDFHDGYVIVYSAAVDIWGVWEVKFNSWNYVNDLNLGPSGDASYSTYTFNINDVAEFTSTTPWIESARVGLVLTDPQGSTWHTDYATTGTPGSAWDIPSFRYRMQLTVPAAQVDSDVTNFPLLVSFADSDFQTKVQSDGDDFVFVQNSNILAHELDRFEPSTGRLVAWVRANLSSTVDNTLWLYYGNPVIGSTQSPETLWSNNYEAVYLLNEDVTNEGSGEVHFDSTASNYTALHNGNSRITGIANGYGQNFDGNDWISINSTEGLEPTGDMTISGWFYISDSWSSTSTPSRMIMAKYWDGDNNFHIALIGSEYTESGVSAGSLAVGFEIGQTEYTRWTQRTAWTSGWYHFAYVMDSSTPSNSKIYINGADNTDAGSHGSISTLSLNSGADWGIGGRYGEVSEFPTGEAFHTGRIDEIRMSSIQRAAGWINVTYENVNNLGPFITEGSEQVRTSPDHSFTKTIDSTASAGVWTVSIYYNDTATTVTNKTGLYEREFIVKHDTSLTLIDPADAVSDKTAYKVAGEILYVEVDLTDDVNADKISGATVKMNWSVSGVPTELTLNDIGSGRYGKSVNTSDLGAAGSYRININSYRQYYNNATDYFDLELYHATELDYTDVDSTPVGNDFTATLVLTDSYDGTPITGATIRFDNGTLVNVVAEGGGMYNISLTTTSLGYGDHSYVFDAAKAGAFLVDGTVNVTFTLRKHFTSVTVIGDLVTPYGQTTAVTVVITDTDTGSNLVTTADVSSWSFTSSYSPVTESPPADYEVTLTTSTWALGPETVTLSVTMTGIYSNPTNHQFDVDMRKHYTSVTVIGDFVTPYGQTTPVTVIITDLDTGADLGSTTDVTSWSFTSGYAPVAETPPADFAVTLTTAAWVVGTESVTLAVTMGGIYFNPVNQQFDIQIRNRYTSVTVIGDLLTPYGFTTSVTLVITDTDSGATLTVSDVSSFTFTPSSYSAQSDPSPSDLLFALDTSTWTVAIETVTLSVVMSGNYDNPSNYQFDVEIRNHYTSVTVNGDLETPYGDTTSLTIEITDLDTAATLTVSAVSSFTFTPSSYSAQSDPSPADLLFDLDTSTWTVATETVTLSVVMSGNYDNPSNYQFDITIRNHYTSATVTGDLVTPYGQSTSLTLVITDLDTAATLTVSAVSSFTFTPSSYSAQSDPSPADLLFDLDTSTWTVATETVTLSVVMSGNYDNPSSYQFDITIRNHYTSATVIGNLVTPYGNVTPLTLVITDLDTAATLTVSAVSSFTFSPSSYSAQSDPSPADLLFDLDTSTWTVATETVTLSVVMSGNYDNPSNYQFDITIRGMTTYVYNEPSDLIFPSGDNFTIFLRVNVSEPGTSYGLPVTGLSAGEFSVPGYPIRWIDTTDQSFGRYMLTVNASYFGDGDYSITVYVNPTNASHSSASLIISFTFRPARSFLSSPNYPQVVTAFDTDVAILLNYTDVDRDLGITGATIGNESINIYDLSELGSGVYNLTIDVAGLAEGSHFFNLTADAAGYEFKYLTFKVTIRIAFTYAIPSTGALDIPVGDDVVFYVDYIDIDHDLPVDNLTGQVSMDSTWARIIVTYQSGQGRYQVTFLTLVDDALVQNMEVNFTFYRANYQNGTFSISVTIRTHNTDFRLVSAVEPVSFNDNITISVFYGDIDTGGGIKSWYISHRVWNGTHDVTSYLFNDTLLGNGYYTMVVPAPQFGGLGIQSFTVYFNWTGPVYTYENSTLVAAANIIGEDSRLTLIVTAEPTPYLENMTYTLLYAALNGTGISNSTGNVFVTVSFVGETVDLNEVDIWEPDPVGQKGQYSIRFNTTLLAKTGLVYMSVFINWSKGVSPFYSNRTDTISVRILARDTLVSIDPPIQTAYGENATLSFTYDDVTGALNEPIADDVKLTISLSLGDYALTYDGGTKTFTVSFDTDQFGSLGDQVFTLNVTWAGAPFYTNQTGRSITVSVIFRQSLLDYQTPPPTQYIDNVTFSVTWTDVAGAASAGILGATITLYDGVSPISTTYYAVYEIGAGEYSVVLNTTYKATPGTYAITVNITSTDFYYASEEDTRSLTIRYRSTITSSEPINTVPFTSSFSVILYYQDLITLDVVGNGSGQVTFDILNGSSWLYSVAWNPSQGYYELTVETYNQGSLVIGTVYSLHINMSYAAASPFYSDDDAYISFELRTRASSLERQIAPVPTQYLDNVSFTVYYSDADDLSPIISVNIYLFKGITQLTLNTEYFYSHLGSGVYEVIVDTTALDGLGVTQVTVQANWTGGTPFHDDASIDVDLSVTRRSTNVEIVTPPSQTNYLENITFIVSFLDLGTGLTLTATKNLVQLYNDAVLLTSAQFSMTTIVVGQTYQISINSTELDAGLVTNRNITVLIDWPDAPNYYQDDSTSTRATTIERFTYVSVDRPGNTAYGENATFTFSFIDSTSIPEVRVAFSAEMAITTNLTETPSLTYNVGTGIFSMSFNTSQFGAIGLMSFHLNITWSGTPYYSSKTLQSVLVTVTLRQTQVSFEAPAPTPYGDNVTFTITYLDIAGAVSEGIPDATLTIYYLGAPVPQVNYYETPDGQGAFTIEFYSGFFSEPGFYDLNASLTYAGSYFSADAYAARTMNVRLRTTILSVEPVGQIGFGTQMQITIFFQDILTLADIANTSSTTFLSILNNTGTPWQYTVLWQPATSNYLLTVETANQPTLALGDHTLWLNMSYVYQDPFYRWDDGYVQFTIRTRTSSLDLQEAPIPTPFGENASFVMFYWDADNATNGIPGATINLEIIAPLILNTDYFVVEGLPGVYNIFIDSAALGALDTYDVKATAVWPGGAPFHNDAERNVSVTTTRRTATVEIITPATQPRYLDNMTFIFEFVDSINSSKITGISSTDITIYLEGSQLGQNDFTMTETASRFEVSVNSTVLGATLISNLNLTIFVNWNDGMSPFYTDDGTTMRVSTRGRSIFVEPQQIETTPINDNMTVSFILTDEDSGAAISNAIVLFSCQTRTIQEGSSFWITEGVGAYAGYYNISVDTTFLLSIGNYKFDLVIHWDPAQSPYYQNRSVITLTGSVDLIWINMQAETPQPSTVQITGNTSVIVELTDLDHGGGVIVPTNVIEVSYYGTGVVPQDLVIDDLGSGRYNISFNTVDLSDFDVQTLNITMDYYPYTLVSVNPTFTTIEITTKLEPQFTEIILNWTQSAHILVDYHNLLNLNLTSGALVVWTYGGQSGSFTEIGGTGTYEAYVDTGFEDSGTRVVTIVADAPKFKLSVTVVTLIVLPLPSDITMTSPEDVFEHPRGDPITVLLYLNDTTNHILINWSYVNELYVTFETIEYNLVNGSGDSWSVILPPSATAALTPGETYSARVTAKLRNFNPVGTSFKFTILATRTNLTLHGAEMSEEMNVFFSDEITFTLNFTEAVAGIPIDSGTVSWYVEELDLTFHFNNTSDGIWTITFNSSVLSFGTWGFTFRGKPTNVNLTETSVSLTLTVKRLPTIPVNPDPYTVYWGWSSEILFRYYDTHFDRGIDGAIATYKFDIYEGNATPLSDGWYSVFVNTSLLEITRYRLTIAFSLSDHEVSNGGVDIVVQDVPTELILSTPIDNWVMGNPTVLQVPFGDTITISFFYNDTDNSEGFIGGLAGATNVTQISGGGVGLGSAFALIDHGNGTYSFVFDTTELWLFLTAGNIPQALPDNPYSLRVGLTLEYRESHDIALQITIIERPTSFDFRTSFVVNGSMTMYYGEIWDIYVTYKEDWAAVSGQGITDAEIVAISEEVLVEVVENLTTVDAGVYRFRIMVIAPLIPLGLGTEVVDINIAITRENYETQELELSVTVIPTEQQTTMGTVISLGTPSLFLILLIVVLWTRHFSIPKQLRQINGQIKALRKGKMPKPVTEAKTRQELLVELFNDTYQGLEEPVTRDAAQMPEESVPVEVPEVGELLIQLSILTHLSPDELDEFKADISKMRISEQAAFVKEVIHQEAIRAARRDGKTIEEVVEEVQAEASRRIAGAEMEELAAEFVPDAERVILPPVEEEIEPPAEDIAEEIKREFEETVTPSDKLSQYEIEELRKDLEARGVPAHEIETIVEQARELPRELVEDLVRSLGGDVEE